MERFGGVFLVAGLLFFAFAFVAMGVIPYLHFVRLPVQSAEEIVRAQESTGGTVLKDFQDLAQRYPGAFMAAFPEGPTVQS